MTEMLKKEFSRKSFVKGGGAMIVGISVVGAGVAGKAQGAIDPYASPGPANPNSVDSFLIVHADNTVSLKSGRIELGQGSTTALRTIVAEELDMDTNQLRHISFDTGGVTPAPNTGNTGGSTSISQGGPLVRRAAVEAKIALLSLASTNLGVPVSGLSVSKGVVSGGGKTVTYGQLVGGKLFNVNFTTTTLNAGVAPAKPISAYTQVGISRVQRDDIPQIVSGVHPYAVNVKIPNMYHARAIRPRGQGAYGDGTNPVPVKIDASSIKNIPDVEIVHVGNVLGVVAKREYDAIQAAAQLKVQWSDPPPISGSGNMWKTWREMDSAGKAPARIAANTGNVENAMKTAAKTYSGTFTFHYQMHAPIGPNVVVADVTKDSAIIYSHVKNGYGNTRPQIAAALSSASGRTYAPDRVRVIYAEGSSSFGGGAQHVDVGETAAVLSMGAGKPVRLQFMRWDEHGWDNYGPATMWDIAAGVDANGKITAFDATSFGPSSYAKTPTESMVGQAMTTPGNGPADTTYSGTQYDIPNRRIIGKTVQTLNNMFKVSTLRAPNALQTCFASEQVIDQLAYLAGKDPYQFRLDNISTAVIAGGLGHWRDTLIGVGKAANWTPRVANSIKQTGDIRTGRGIALGGFAGSQSGVVAEIEVNMKSGKIVAKHMYASQVAGLTVAPALVENQMSGSLIMSVSRSLTEAVVFDKGRVTSLDWVTYPLLRMKDSPTVTTVPVQRLDLQPTGSGEPPAAPVAGAIANAFFDATGVRLHKAPMTPASVRAELKAAGVL